MMTHGLCLKSFTDCPQNDFHTLTQGYKSLLDVDLFSLNSPPIAYYSIFLQLIDLLGFLDHIKSLVLFFVCLFIFPNPFSSVQTQYCLLFTCLTYSLYSDFKLNVNLSRRLSRYSKYHQCSLMSRGLLFLPRPQEILPSLFATQAGPCNQFWPMT